METERPVVDLVKSFSARVGIPFSVAMIGGGFVGFGAGALCWLAVDSDLRTVLSVAGSVGLLAAGVIWQIEYKAVPLHEVTRTIAPEPAPEREPIIVRSYTDRPRPQTNRRKWQFLEACRKLAAQGEPTRLRSFEPQFGKDEALRLRDELVTEGYLSIDNPKRKTFVVSSSCLSGGGGKETSERG